MTPRTELSRLRREHSKAHKLYKATHKPCHWKAMRNLVTAIVRVSAPALRASGRTLAGAKSNGEAA